MEATNLAGLYNLPLLDWSGIEARLEQGLSQAPGTGGPDRHTCWLATINPDGSPHVTGVGALWADGCFWFETGLAHPQGQKSRPRPAVHAQCGGAGVRSRRGGRGHPGHRPGHRGRYGGALGSGRLAGPGRRHGAGTDRRVQRALGRAAPWHVYRLTPRAATALGTVDPGGATRWRF